MDYKKEVEEYYVWHLDICQKMTPLLLEGHRIETEKVANGEKGWVLNEWLKDQDYELYRVWEVVKAVVNLHSDTTLNSDDIDTVMDYYVECNRKSKKAPHIIEILFANNLASYMQAKKDGKPITLDQAFGYMKKKGGQPRSNRLTPEVQGITKQIIENELELTLAIQAYQEVQMDDNKDEETSTETLRTMFHEQKVDALMDYILRFKIEGKTMSDKAKDLVGEYWTKEQDPLKIGTRKDS